jgi:hypothetical protein
MTKRSRDVTFWNADWYSVSINCDWNVFINYDWNVFAGQIKVCVGSELACRT